MTFPAAIGPKRLSALTACALVAALWLPGGPAAAVEPALAVAVAAPAVAVPTPPARPMLEVWSDLIAARLAQTNPATPAVAPPVGGGTSLTLKSSGPRTDRLAAQLQARGFLAANAYHGVYDDTLASAVAAYQASVGMQGDGVAGDSTIDALDRDPAATAIALKTTLDGLRSFTADAPPEVFVVNIPSQTAYLLRDGKLVLTMRTAVGRPSRPTPLLTDHVTDVVLNPTWTAPHTVLAKDKLPSLRRTHHPGIENATIYLDHQEVDPATVDWATVTADRIRVVQSPGDQNALGRIKFNLTNGQSIYMHDTNDHTVFARQNRALSSGCVRLAEPRELAEFLLGREGWSSERIDNAIDSGHTQYVSLNHPLAVRFVYWQASVDEAGMVHVHKDIYGQNGPRLAESTRRLQSMAIMPPRQLIGSRPHGSAKSAADEAPGIEGLFHRLMSALASSVSPPPAAQPTASLPLPSQLEQVAVQDAPPSDNAHCTESCGWGLY